MPVIYCKVLNVSLPGLQNIRKVAIGYLKNLKPTRQDKVNMTTYRKSLMWFN